MLEQEIKKLNETLITLIRTIEDLNATPAPATTESAQLELPLDEAPAKTVTRGDVQNKLAEYAGKLGKPAAKELLNKYDAAKMSEIKKEDYTALIAVIANALEKEAD